MGCEALPIEYYEFLDSEKRENRTINQNQSKIKNGELFANELKLSPFKYDITKFNLEIRRIAAREKRSQDHPYYFPFSQCQTYAKSVIAEAKRNSKRNGGI
jgi:ATP phosphoribosyltransferase regulatory subunit HisZ